MTFTEKLLKLLKEKSLTRKQFLEDMHFGKNQFTYWSKNDTLPNQSTLDAIAQYFNVSVDYLKDDGITENAIAKPFPDTHSILSEEERLLLEAFRMADTQGRMNIIYVCMDEKRKAEAKGDNTAAV